MAAASPLKLRIEGMDCGACAVKIESALRPLPGVFDISVSYSQASLSLMLDEDRTSRAAVETRIKALGLSISGPTESLATGSPNHRITPSLESTIAASTA